MEDFSMSEKILRSIETIINNDPDLEDFTIIPTFENNRNKSPVLHADHHLGLESWCVKYLYNYACSKLMKVRKKLANKKLGFSAQEDLNYVLSGALLINPDVTTFWNMRRELVQENVLKYEEELRFSRLVITRKAKSLEAFSYRRWLYDRFLQRNLQKQLLYPDFIAFRNEFNLCYGAADNAANNYHAWTHRQWCLMKLHDEHPSQIVRELHGSERWVRTHVSDHCGYHYRQFLVERVRNCTIMPLLHHQVQSVMAKLNVLFDGDNHQLKEYLLGSPVIPNAKSKINLNYIALLLYELLVLIETINKHFIDHESLWLHRRSVMYKLLEAAYEYLGLTFPKQQFVFDLKQPNANIVSVGDYGESQPKISKTQPSKFTSTKLYSILCDTEKAFIEKNLKRSPLQSELARRYEKWLRYFLVFEM